MGSWLEQMDDETRQTFTDTVFYPLEATGMETFSEISDQKWKIVESVLDAAKQIPREKQKEVLHLLGQLGQIGTQTVTSYLTGLVKGKESEDPPEDIQTI